jgi:hypothetical protein
VSSQALYPGPGCCLCVSSAGVAQRPLVSSVQEQSVQRGSSKALVCEKLSCFSYASL